MADQTHQSKKLEMLGVSDKIEDADEEDAGDYMVRCPRCGFIERNLSQDKAHSVAHKSGCPDCERATNDLGAGPEEDPEPLTTVGAPLAVSPMA